MRILLLLCTLLFAGSLYAEPQEEVLAACRAQTRERALTGAARDDYMKECVGTKAVAEDGTSTRMGECALHAAEKSLQGDDKKKFMQACMAGEH